MIAGPAYVDTEARGRGEVDSGATCRLPLPAIPPDGAYVDGCIAEPGCARIHIDVYALPHAVSNVVLPIGLSLWGAACSYFLDTP